MPTTRRDASAAARNPRKRASRLARRHPDTGEPTGGAYPTGSLADAPPYTPCVPRDVNWGVPADRCRALGALPAMSLERAFGFAPLPSALAAALWTRCPRDDARMWRLTDTLSEDDAARLEGWSGDRPPWLQVGVGACTDDCKDCWPAQRGIPLADGTLARLAPGQDGRMLALVDVTCPACEGEGRIGFVIHTITRNIDNRVTCPACAGTGRRPLVEVAREVEGA